MRVRSAVLIAVVGAGSAAIAWYFLMRHQQGTEWLGYAEADYVKVAPTQQGRLVTLSVQRGDEVSAGTLLFAQDPVADQAARDQARAELAQAQEKLADMQRGGREQEVLQARADVVDMQASYDRVARDFARNTPLVASGAVTRQSVDQLRDDTRSAAARLDSARAKLALLQDSSAREHAIAAQRAAVEAAQASLQSAQWRLDQRTVVAPADGLIADTFARPGETIAAGGPVVSLLPAANIFVRFFVPEADLSRLHSGDELDIRCDSCAPNLRAVVAFIATGPEYTPPVIYSQGSRGSLVYMVEAHPDSTRRPLLKPGQPVDVVPPARSAAR